MDAAECGRAAVWVAGLCAAGLGGAVLVLLPRDPEGADAGLAAGIAFGAIAAAVWYVAAVCRAW